MQSITDFFGSIDSENLDSWFSDLIRFILWSVFILFLGWFARKMIQRTTTDQILLYRSRKITRYLSYFLIFLLAIFTFVGEIKYFTIAIGIMSAGVALALQEVILSFAGWIAILTSNIYKTGDRIEINQIKGDVIDIGMTRTTLMEIGVWVSSDNYSGRIVQVSNAFVFKGTVHNYSTDFPFVWDEINLPVQYDSDLVLVDKIIRQTAQENLMDYTEIAKEEWKHLVKNYLIENANVEPTLTLKLTDNWIEFNFRYVVDYKKRRITKDQLYKEIYKQFKINEPKVKLASATFSMVDMPDLNVNLKNY
ncbi:mechanosensitive ion channel family protein [Namhaeicola litoreus]|uniref:Mechanosensitive ion channel family protein n=1 Tax=Namhaeicola litoreus TaxID=1052145 RepID=A0ABW3Y1X2_9FLAO